MRSMRGGRVAPLFCALFLAGVCWLLSTRSASAACDPGYTCERLYGHANTSGVTATFSTGWGPNVLGERFQISSGSVELHELRWYRESASTTRPLGFQLWEDGVQVPWSGSGGMYTDVADNGAAGWQVSPLSGSNRRTLTTGHVYTISIPIAAGSRISKGPANSAGYPLNQGALSWIGHRRTDGNVTNYPTVTDTALMWVDVGVQYGGASATATATIAPTATATPPPTATATPPPTATATPPPTATSNPWAGFPTQIPYPTQLPYPTPVAGPDYTDDIERVGNEVGRIAWEIGHLPERVFAAMLWALIPDQQWMQENAAEVRAAWEAQVPAPAQVGALGASIQAGVTESACEGAIGVTYATPYGSTAIPPPEFCGWWAPWRTVAGVLIVLTGAVSAAIQLMRVLKPDA